MNDQQEARLTPGPKEVFEQSWQYIRHAQAMFWQSFASLFTVIMAILVFAHNQSYSEWQTRAVAAAVFAAVFPGIVGFFVVGRVIVVLREHFVTINRVREKCGLDSLGRDEQKPVILPRWKTYNLRGWRLLAAETVYMCVAHQLYVLLVSMLCGYALYLSDLFGKSWAGWIAGSVLFAVIALGMEWWAISKVYRCKDVERYDPSPQVPCGG